jgi:hypothetical protein
LQAIIQGGGPAQPLLPDHVSGTLAHLNPLLLEFLSRLRFSSGAVGAIAAATLNHLTGGSIGLNAVAGCLKGVGLHVWLIPKVQRNCDFVAPVILRLCIAD